MRFQEQFETWLSNSLEEEIPAEVVAFHFNLYESTGQDDVIFGIDLIGAESFDPDDSDWACDEVWAPAERILYIPVSDSGKDWEECLERMSTLIQTYLDSDLPAANTLKSKSGIGIGFVDGDLKLIWQA
ncbi:hypothetical protein Mal35_47270 [Gimesia maris]|uniref:hypothetical protein n=1 Tax=Gimesia maris TaxID=122 RepID=UPI001189B440|nr:hypothetical protein [Gimesia maris]QDT81246.1 hypothetical protein Mal35_47270 [Gimesia maris]